MKTKTKIEVEARKPDIQTELDPELKLKIEIEKLGQDASKVFIESPENPDHYSEYPKVVVCSLDPARYVYPVLLKLEHSNMVRLEALNNYVSTILRLCEMLSWCTEIRLKRKRKSVNTKTNRPLLTNEYIVEKIPACRS